LSGEVDPPPASDLALPSVGALDERAPRERVRDWIAVVVCSLLTIGLWFHFARAEATAAASATKPALTDEQIEELVEANPLAWGALIAGKYVLAIAGVVVALLYLSRRRAVRRGALPAPTPRSPTTPVSLFGAIGVLVLYFATIVGLAAIGTALEAREVIAPGTMERRETGILVMSVGLPFALWIVWVRRRRAAAPPLPLRSRLAAALRVFVVASTVTFILGLVAIVGLQEIFGVKPRPQELVEEAVTRPGPLFLWMLAFFGVFVAPFIEESIFRGLLYPAVRKVGGPVVAAFVVALGFALMHDANATAFLPLVGLALLLAGLFEATDSLLAVTTVHALHNFTTLAPLLLMQS
jgi:membrane protease YdiL (CAAX protease family)